MARKKLEEFRARDAEGRAKAETLQSELEQDWHLHLRELYRLAARRLPHFAPKARTAAAVPDWSVPDPDEVLSLVTAALDLRRGGKKRVKVLRATTEDTLRAFGIGFDVTNPLLDGVAKQAGYNIVAIAEQTRRDIMAVIQNGYDQGLSIPDVAEALRSQAPELTDHRAKRIARTELIGLVNGGSWAAARLTEAAPYKQWLSAMDSRVRPDHVDAHGQTKPIHAPFVVGGAEMQYPGDQTAPAREVVHCRCTVIYPEGPQGDPLLAGGYAVPTTKRAALRLRRSAKKPPDLHETALVAAAEPGVRWRALLVPEGVWTSDGRMIDVGATDWRELPLALMVQTETDIGHDGAKIAGRIDNIYRDEATATVWGEGEFDSGIEGTEAARLVKDQTLRGVSVDLADMEIELEFVGPDGETVPIDPDTGEPTDPQAEIVDIKMRATKAVIMGATVTPFPAFAEARIELADAAEGAVPASAQIHNVLTLQPVTAAAVDNSQSGSMVALFPLSDEADELAQEGGQPPADLHLTLAFLPDGPSHQDLAAALEGMQFEPMEFEVTGAGHFAAGEEGTPLVALIDAPGLDRLRVAVLDALDTAGLVYATNHGFIPHVTLSYQEEAALPAQDFSGMKLNFLAVAAVGPDGRTDLPAESGSGSAQPPPARRPPAPANDAGQASVRVPSLEELSAAKAAVEAGLFTVDEVRAAFGLPAVPGGSLPADTPPELALVYAALEAVRTVATPQPVTVSTDLSAVAEAVAKLGELVAAGNAQVASALAASAAQAPAQPQVFVVERGGLKKLEVRRDPEGRVVEYQEVNGG